MASVSYKVEVWGMVQGVGFRASMAQVAARHGVAGWVLNRDDGVVLSVLQGEEADVEKVIEWARRGPPSAMVEEVRKVKLESYPPQSGFAIMD